MVRIGDLGEKAFIRDVLAPYARTASVGALDDCIVIDLEHISGAADLPCLVYSMDHPSPIDRPLPAGFGWRFYGRWLAACTSNDVLAMGARPQGFSLDLALPADTDVAVVRQLYDGITDVLGEYGAAFEGGNTDINQRVETVAMCWGTVPRAGLIRRSGARPGDYLAVTTELGIGWASYVLRQRGLFDGLSAQVREELAEYNLMPLAPHRAIVAAGATVPGAITSGMDLSDGLVEFLYGIEETTGHGALIEERLIPVSSTLKECAAALDVPAAVLAIEYGYDTPRGHGYTVAPDRWDELQEVFVAHGAQLHRVGTVTMEPGVEWLPFDGPPRPLPKFWDDKCQRDDAVSDWFAVVRDGLA